MRERIRRPRPEVVDDLRLMWPVAIIPSAAAVLVVITAVVIALVASNSSLGEVPVAAAYGWQAVHQVPITIAGTTLGYLPLLPTLAVILGVAGQVARATVGGLTTRELGLVAAAALGFPLIVSALSSVIIEMAGTEGTAMVPSVPRLLLSVLAVHAIGLVLGLGPWFFADLLDLADLPRWVGEGIARGLMFLAALWALGGVVVSVGYIAQSDVVYDGFALGRDAVGMTGLTIVSLLYLPNLMFSGAALLVGAETQLGYASAGVFATQAGQVPALPLAGVFPQYTGHEWWWLAVLIVPAALVVELVRRGTRQGRSFTAECALVGVAGLTAGAVGAAVAAAQSGGLGALGRAGVDAAVFGAAAAVWLWGVGLLTVGMMWLGGRLGQGDDRWGGLRRRGGPAPMAASPVESTGAGVEEADAGPTVGQEEAAQAENATEPRVDPDAADPAPGADPAPVAGLAPAPRNEPTAAEPPPQADGQPGPRLADPDQDPAAD